MGLQKMVKYAKPTALADTQVTVILKMTVTFG
jgi:hypothetical protein